MEHVEWNEQYSVGNDQLDQQHKRIVSMINSLGDAMEAGSVRPTLMKILSDLAGYTKTHFANEELVMKQNYFAELESHHEQHMHLNQQLADYFRNFYVSSKPQTVEVMEFLKHWLYDHILEQDKKYSHIFLKVS